MSIAKLKLDESTKLEFGVAITGAESRPITRFVIEGEKYSITFPCRPVGDGIEVDVGELDNIFEAGEYPVRLEVIIEDKVYIPFEDTITLEPNVHITTKPKETKVRESVKVEQVVVKASKAAPRPEPKTQLTEAEVKKQRKLATLIAETTNYKFVEGQTNRQIIEESLHSCKALPQEKHKLLIDMLKAAKSADITFSTKVIPTSL